MNVPYTIFFEIIPSIAFGYLLADLFRYWRSPRRRVTRGKLIWVIITSGDYVRVYSYGANMSKILHIGMAAATLTATYNNKEGGDAKVVGVPGWVVAPDGIATVTPAADGMSAVVTPVALGVATITVTAEGDETAGVDTITLSADVEVAEEEATGGKLTFS